MTGEQIEHISRYMPNLSLTIKISSEIVILAYWIYQKNAADKPSWPYLLPTFISLLMTDTLRGPRQEFFYTLFATKRVEYLRLNDLWK